MMKPRWLHILMLLFFIIFSVFLPVKGSAMSEAQQKIFQRKIYYFNAEACGATAPDTSGDVSADPETASTTLGCCQNDSSTQLSGRNPAEKVWNFFIDKGLSNIQVAGIMGNLQVESSFSPTAMYPSTHGTDPTVDVAWGLGQWTNGKAVGVKRDSGASGSILSLATQLDMMWWELNNRSPTGQQHIINKLKTIHNLSEAVIFWQIYYEGSGTQGRAQRQAAAITWKNHATGGSGSSTPATADATGGDCGSSDDSSSSDTGDGKVEFASGANLPGKPVTDVTTDYLKKVSGIYGKTLICTTGTNHDKYTVDGNISDHYSGHACDIGMSANHGTDDGPVGDAIMKACLVAAGDSPKEAAKTAKIRNGPVQTRTNNGLRIQCIWGTNAGGNHHNHVHIGARPG